MREAGNLNCPMCGASAATDAPTCQHCGTRLATVSCPSCFAMIFEGSKFCPQCGTRRQRAAGAETELACPRCKSLPLVQVQLGSTPVNECTGCHGLWVEAATFDSICTDREKQSIVLGNASASFEPGLRPVDLAVRYARCPVCRELMHRVNFAKCSGIVIDVCKGHGSWFDRDELQHIVEFIRTGGLDLARAKEKAELEAARKRLEAARRAHPDYSRPSDPTGGLSFGEPELLDIAGSIAKFFLR